MRLVLLVALLGGVAGCTKAPPLQPKATGRLVVRVPQGNTQVLSDANEVPQLETSFEGAPGHIRVTLEVEGQLPSGRTGTTSLNDVLFRASGDGRIVLTIKKPDPTHPRGEVQLLCQSAGEESLASFEPSLWFDKPSSIVVFEPTINDAGSAPVEGREMTLGRFVARNLPQDIRVTLKAVFSARAMPPRTNAGTRAAN